MRPEPRRAAGQGSRRSPPRWRADALLVTVTEDTFDAVADRAAQANIFTRGPMGSRGKGRALFMLDPDGNETEVNTRYLYGVPKR